MRGRKRKYITVSDKLNVLKLVKESGNKKRVDIAKELGIAPSTLNSLVAKATEIEESAHVFGVLTNERIGLHIKGGKLERLENCVLQRFQQHRAEGIPTAGPVVCEKANELYPG